MTQLEALYKMSADEKAVLQTTWTFIAKAKKELSTKIFIKIFESQPDARALFHFARDSDETPREMAASAGFQFHALRFIQVIESTVEHLSSPDDLAPILTNLGRVHAKVSDTRGFESQYWSAFIDATLAVLRRFLKERPEVGDSSLDETMQLWNVVLVVIVRCMKVGYEEALETRNENRSNR